MICDGSAEFRLSTSQAFQYGPERTDRRLRLFAGRQRFAGVQSVLRHSAHILAGNPRELPGQLLGRLPETLSSDIWGLHSQAAEWKGSM
jgi:hypothetical protein